MYLLYRLFTSLKINVQPLQLKLQMMPKCRHIINYEHIEICKESFMVHFNITTQNNLMGLNKFMENIFRVFGLMLIL